MKAVRVGIDLAMAEERGRAPGTARHVEGQGRELLKLEGLGWEWVPLVGSAANPLWPEIAHLAPRIVPGRRISARATFSVGPAWEAAGCRLAFATSGIVPAGRLPVVANFLDATIYEHARTWIDSGRRLNYYLLRMLAAYAVRKARRLFILSEYGRRKMLEFYPGAAEKFVVTPCGLTDLCAPAPEPPAWAPARGEPFFLHVGIFSENKNQRRLIEVWGRLQQAHPAAPSLVLIGPGDSEYLRSRIEPVLAKLPRPREVILAGAVADPELSWAYRHAHAYLQPSVSEGFGLPIIEAMRAGLPVGCSNTTSLPEVAGGAALLFDPGDPDAILGAVTALWRHDEEQRARWIALGLERSRQFTWKASAQRVALEIDRVLSKC